MPDMVLPSAVKQGSIIRLRYAQQRLQHYVHTSGTRDIALTVLKKQQ
jgi:hypothetical protein